MNFDPIDNYHYDICRQNFKSHFDIYKDLLLNSNPSYSITGLLDEESSSLPYLDAITDSFLPPKNNSSIGDFFDAKKSSDPIDNFFGAKKQFLENSIENVLGMIYERKQILYDHSKQIDYNSSKIKSRLFEIIDFRTGINPNIDKLRGNIEKEISNFEREKRMEEISCWQDVTRLKTDLREILETWSHEKQKESLLNE